MRYTTFILFVAVICGGGCQGVSNHVKQSLNHASADYHRVTTGASSSYIANQRSQR